MNKHTRNREKKKRFGYLAAGSAALFISAFCSIYKHCYSALATRNELPKKTVQVSDAGYQVSRLAIAREQLLTGRKSEANLTLSALLRQSSSLSSQFKRFCKFYLLLPSSNSQGHTVESDDKYLKHMAKLTKDADSVTGFTFVSFQSGVQERDIRESYEELSAAKQAFAQMKNKYLDSNDEDKPKLLMSYLEAKILYMSWALLVAEQLSQADFDRYVTAESYFAPGFELLAELEAELKDEHIKYFLKNKPTVLVQYDAVKVRQKHISAAYKKNTSLLNERVSDLQKIAGCIGNYQVMYY